MKGSNGSKETLLEEDIKEALNNFFNEVKIIDLNNQTIKGTSEACKDSCGIFKETGECICKKSFSSGRAVSRFVKHNTKYKYYCCSMIKNKNGKSSMIMCYKDVDDTFELSGNANNKDMKEICKINSSAYRDALTGLNNRKYIDDNIRFMSKELSDSKKLFSVLCIDIDKFKRYNDDYGHETGDLVLKTLADLMLEPEEVKFGKIIPIRIGGDEFIAIGNGISRHEFLKYANYLLLGIDKKKIKTNKGYTGVSISIGISDSSKCGTYEYGSIYTQADSKLYEAKNKGRNQICY